MSFPQGTRFLCYSLDNSVGRLWGYITRRRTGLQLKFLAWRFFAVDRAARPTRGHDSAAAIAIARGDGSTGLLDQSLGNEEAEPHAFFLSVIGVAAFRRGRQRTRPRGDIGLTDLFEDFRGEPRAVVHHLDRKLLIVPARAQTNFAGGKIGRV